MGKRRKIRCNQAVKSMGLRGIFTSCSAPQKKTRNLKKFQMYKQGFEPVAGGWCLRLSGWVESTEGENMPRNISFLILLTVPLIDWELNVFIQHRDLNHRWAVQGKTVPGEVLRAEAWHLLFQSTALRSSKHSVQLFWSSGGSPLRRLVTSGQRAL